MESGGAIHSVRDFAEKLATEKNYPPEFIALVPPEILELKLGGKPAYDLDDEADEIILRLKSSGLTDRDPALKYVKEFFQGIYYL